MPLNDYIICVFCLIDDIYHQLTKNKPIRNGGYPPTLTDSEVITMLLIGEFLSLADNKKIWFYFKSHFLCYFPKLQLVGYKAFNKQATGLWHVIRLIHYNLAKHFARSNVNLVDGIPFPICHLERSKRPTLFKGMVAKHFCAAKEEHYYGFKLLLLTTVAGIPVDYAVAPANIDERKLLLDIAIPKNSILIGDKGYISTELEQLLRESNNTELITPKRKNMFRQWTKDLAQSITKIRRRIETSISQLTEIFSINKTKARSLHGMLGRINRKVLSYTVALFFNFQVVKDQFTRLEFLIKD